jgi:Flp pilus assembly pilin Flp
MKAFARIWQEEDGVLSFEWTLLLTLLTIGIVSGLTAARDAIIDELGDIAEAAQAIDQSYSLAAITLLADLDNDGAEDDVVFTTNASVYTEIDGVDNAFTDCGRTDYNPGQGPQDDFES